MFLQTRGPAHVQDRKPGCAVCFIHKAVPPAGLLAFVGWPVQLDEQKRIEIYRVRQHKIHVP